MYGGLRNLARFDAILDRLVGIVGQGWAFASGDHRRDCDRMAVPAAQARTVPDLAVKALLSISIEGGRDGANLIGRQAASNNVRLLGPG